jgi:hypothetical protein
VHVFVCSGCTQIAESKSTISAVSTPPKKLSAPRHRHAA